MCLLIFVYFSMLWNHITAPHNLKFDLAEKNKHFFEEKKNSFCHFYSLLFIMVLLNYFLILKKAYQYRVLPFGLALSPHTFTKCVGSHS